MRKAGLGFTKVKREELLSRSPGSQVLVTNRVLVTPAGGTAVPRSP